MKGTLVHCIQGKDTASGKIGSFVYSNDEPFKAVSPVFVDLVGLYRWMEENDLVGSGVVSDLRVYRKEEP